MGYKERRQERKDKKEAKRAYHRSMVHVSNLNRQSTWLKRINQNVLGEHARQARKELIQIAVDSDMTERELRKEAGKFYRKIDLSVLLK